MTQVLTVPAVTAALIAQGTVTVITAAESGIDGRVLIRADERHYEPEVPCEWPSGIVVHPGCIVASGSVEWVPITDENDCPLNSRHAHLGVWPMVDQPRRLYLFGPNIKTYGGLDLTDQLPYGDFTPGRWAGILTDVKPTTDRCPACWGVGQAERRIDADGCLWSPICDPCNGRGTCPPIQCDDVKDWP